MIWPSKNASRTVGSLATGPPGTGSRVVPSGTMGQFRKMFVWTSAMVYGDVATLNSESILVSGLFGSYEGSTSSACNSQIGLNLRATSSLVVNGKGTASTTGGWLIRWAVAAL